MSNRLWQQIEIADVTLLTDRWSWEPKMRSKKQRCATNVGAMALHILDHSTPEATEPRYPINRHCDICKHVNYGPKRGDTDKKQKGPNKAQYRCERAFRNVCSDMKCIQECKNIQNEIFKCLCCNQYVFNEEVNPAENEYGFTNSLEVHPLECNFLPKWVPTMENLQGIWETSDGPIHVKGENVYFTEKSQKAPRWLEAQTGGQAIWLEPDHLCLNVGASKKLYDPNSSKLSVKWNEGERKEVWIRLVIPHDPLGPSRSQNPGLSPRSTRALDLKNDFNAARSGVGIREACNNLVKKINLAYRLDVARAKQSRDL